MTREEFAKITDSNIIDDITNITDEIKYSSIEALDGLIYTECLSDDQQKTIIEKKESFYFFDLIRYQTINNKNQYLIFEKMKDILQISKNPILKYREESESLIKDVKNHLNDLIKYQDLSEDIQEELMEDRFKDMNCYDTLIEYQKLNDKMIINLTKQGESKYDIIKHQALSDAMIEYFIDCRNDTDIIEELIEHQRLKDEHIKLIVERTEDFNIYNKIMIYQILNKKQKKLPF